MDGKTEIHAPVGGGRDFPSVKASPMRRRRPLLSTFPSGDASLPYRWLGFIRGL